MALLGTGFRRILLLIIIAIAIILIALNVILNMKLRAEIPKIIEQFSNESPYKINVQNISLDPFFRLQADKVSVSDSTSETNDLLNIKKVRVNPNILSSLLSQKVVVGELVINSPKVQANQENIKNLTNFINQLREDRKDDQSSLVEFGSIKILYADFHITPDFIVSVPELNIDIDNKKLQDSQTVNVEGTVGIHEKDIGVDGAVNMSSGKTTGEFNLNVDEINLNNPPSLLGDSENLKLQTKLNFEVSDLINLNGLMTLGSDKGVFSEKSFAEIEYDLNYNQSSDTATVNSLVFQVNDLMEGSFKGDIQSVIRDTVFNLSGTISTLDLRDILVRIFDHDYGILSGKLNPENLKISGSRTKESIQLSGNAGLRDFIFNSENETGPSIDNLNCELKVNQSLHSSNNFLLSSLGKCTAGEFNWDRTGPVTEINARVELNSKNRWQDNKIELTNIRSRFMQGSAAGTLNFFLSEGFGGGINNISGTISGRDLDLEKTPKTILPANIAGRALSANASFEGGSGNYDADISIQIENFLLKSKLGREFRVSNLQTSSPVDFLYQSADADDITSNDAQVDEIIIKGQGLSYRELSFEEYRIGKGTVKDAAFLLELGNDRWSLNMSSEGSDFNILGHDVSLAEFSENLLIENSGREGFKGSIKGIGGRYKSTDFPNISWDYNFINNRIIVSNVSAQISTLGQFRTDNLYINVGQQAGGYPYEVNFEDATFAGFEDKLKSEGIKGNIIINRPGTADKDWHGKVNINKTSIISAVIENISNTITPSPGGINLENITGTFLGGDITGDIYIDTSTTPSGINTDLKLVNASIESPSTNIKLNQSKLKFLGTLPNGGLPEGDGTLELGNVILDNQGTTSKLNAEINTKTIAETLYIEKGFIEGNGNQEIRFSGRLTNTLNENRMLELEFPEVPISDAVAMLSPLMPEAMREFKTSGYATMDLVFLNLFYPESLWGGTLNLRNSSLSGNYGGALLSVKDINGKITIKDNVSSKNPLADIMGKHLKLSKSIFQKFQKSFKESNLQKEDLDFLTISKIDYGILTFENVEVALEIDRNKINLRRLISKLFRGDLYGAGLFKFNSDQSDYNLSLLFNEISLEGISEKLSPNQEYITGLLNGLLWLRGEGAELNTIDGPFKFWSKKSSREPRKIGQALLNQLGARERLVLGSYRSYDNANISGYIKDGLMTFREFNVTNRFLGFKNLSIQADPVRNSITIEHLISVIRELSRRSETGGPRIETN